MPELVGASRNLHYLERLNGGWLAAGFAFEAASLLAYALLTWTVLPHATPGDLAGPPDRPGDDGGRPHRPWGVGRLGGPRLPPAHLERRLGHRRRLHDGDPGDRLGGRAQRDALARPRDLDPARRVPHQLHRRRPARHHRARLLRPPHLPAHPRRGAGDAPRAAGRTRAAPGHPDRLEATFRHLGDSLRTLATSTDRRRSALVWAATNWMLDAAALWSFLAALGRYVNPIELFAAYGIANVLAAIPITPGGLGFVEASLPLLLASFGVTKNVALLGVLGWRIVNFWLPIPIGAGCYLSLKLRRGEGLRASRRALADLAIRLPPPEPPRLNLTRAARPRRARRRAWVARPARHGRRTRPRGSARGAPACAGRSTARARVRP